MLTHQAECARSLNFFMLGVLSARLTIDAGAWHEALENLLSKKSLDVNLEMFSAGRRVATPVQLVPVRAAAPRPAGRPIHAKLRTAEPAVAATAAVREPVR